MVNWVLLMQIHLFLYFLQILDFLVADLAIFLEEEIMHFSWSLKYWNWSCYQFWLSKMYNKNKYNSYPNYNGKVEGGFSPERWNIGISKMYFHGVFNRHWSKLLDYESINSPHCPATWFAYILMPGKEEWVLV